MNAGEYFSNLKKSLDALEVRDEKGASLTQDKGFQRAIEWIREAGKARAKVIFVGNGGSAAIASHQAVDLWKNGGIRAVAFNDASLLTCVSNDYSYSEVFEKPLAMFADPADILIAISSSGRSSNILKAAEKAKAIGCRVVTMSGFKPDNPLRKTGHLNFYIPSEAYGFVEIAHHTLCHYITDHFVARAGASQ
jgi:D-sedoheptulose 7-phosphate isomerase